MVANYYPNLCMLQVQLTSNTAQYFDTLQDALSNIELTTSDQVRHCMAFTFAAWTQTEFKNVFFDHEDRRMYVIPQPRWHTHVAGGVPVVPQPRPRLPPGRGA
jgi:hypothetical protein